ncbi:Coiled-coil domain-containing protein 39 [Orchesella cincta]|uniref:Coiled-coil domain-containing protein 39 n=1 Tax=Orchesella cincta TaxID=48709 RepID=A0A1D2NM77_ORCCI|nr:Coiled-coil domain-containing protein 39 [Orchesella cincta]
MANYRTIRDITQSNARRIDDVDPELAVVNLDHTKSYMPLKSKESKGPVAYEDIISKSIADLSSDLLEQGGWGNGARLPFSNRENNELEKILELKQRKYLLLQTELRDNAEHLTMLEDNFTRASEDIVSYQNFLASKKKQIEDEKSLCSLSERYYSRAVQDTKTTEKALKQCRKSCERMKCSQERRLKNLCELRDLIEFDRDALSEYHQRLKSYQNQKFELGRIIKEDSKTIEQIDKTYVELGARRKILKMELDQQAMTTSKCQEQLDRLSVEFRKVYRHRQEMITMWSTNIENAKKKDAQMQDVADDYFDVRERIRDLMSELDFRERQYKSVQCGIRSVGLKISEMDNKLAELRRVLQHFKEVVIQLQDSLIEVQQDIRATSIEQKNIQAAVAKLEASIAKVADSLSKISGVVEKLRAKLQDVYSLRKSSDQYIDELELILNDENKKEELVLRDLELTRKYFWERSNDKKSICSDITHYESSIQRLVSNLANLEAKEFSNLEFLAKQSAKVYRLDLDSSTLENKISRAQNEAVNPQFYLLQSKLMRMRDAEAKFSEERKYIMKELTNIQLFISKNDTEIANNREQKSLLNTALLEINMVSQRTQKLIDQADKSLQDLQVENSLESVNLKRLTDAMKMAREHLFGLSEERNTIYWAVNERKTEIENHRVLNLSKSKALLDAVNKLRVQIQEMEGRTQKLKGRLGSLILIHDIYDMMRSASKKKFAHVPSQFELVTKMMTGSQTTGSDEESVAYKVRKAARERESLQLELHKWEARVEDGRNELAGLENASNMAIKETLTPIKDGSSESQELDILNQEEKAIHVRKSRALRFKSVLIDKIEDLKQKMAVMEQESQATGQLCKMKAAMASKIENELHKQKEKTQRWSTLCCKMLKEIKPMIGGVEYDILQQDLKLRFFNEKLECAFTMLDKLLVAFPQLKPFIHNFFEKDQVLSSLLLRVMKPALSVSFGKNLLVSKSALGRPSQLYIEDVNRKSKISDTTMGTTLDLNQTSSSTVSKSSSVSSFDIEL